MSAEEALSNVIDKLDQFIKSNKERTQQLEGERTTTRYLLERMNERLIKSNMQSNHHEDDPQLRILIAKLDLFLHKMNELREKIDRLESIISHFTK